MAEKLSQSLDEIVSSRAGGRARRSQRRVAGGRSATQAPVGGIQKSTKQTRAAIAKSAPTKGSTGSGESKVMISNLVRNTSLSSPIRPKFWH